VSAIAFRALHVDATGAVWVPLEAGIGDVPPPLNDGDMNARVEGAAERPARATPGAGQERRTPSHITYDVFAADGIWLGQVRVPFLVSSSAATSGDSRFVVRDIGTDYVLGVATDDLGVESVVSFRLEREH
jgi:hypothetical protein